MAFILIFTMASSVSTRLECVACGAEASDHLHYGAVCCFSCRAFFRRYADRYEALKCAKGGDCAVDVLTRNDCMKCRLRKCYAGGMKKV